MSEHESKVTVKLSMSIDIFTESHPEDIDDETLRRIILDHLVEQIKANVSHDAADIWMDDFELDEVKMTERCSLCGKECDPDKSHLHQGAYIGDECCWDEQLRSSE